VTLLGIEWQTIRWGAMGCWYSLAPLFFPVGFGGCADQRPWWEKEGLAHVGTIAGTEDDQRHTSDLLRAHKFDSIIEGSVSYGIFVPHARACEAINVLLRDRAIHGGTYLTPPESRNRKIYRDPACPERGPAASPKLEAP